MRVKMRAALDKSSAELFDLKQGEGGITDIEFMVQYLILREAHAYPRLCRYSDNIRLLQSLENEGLVDAQWRERLAAVYRELRAAHHRNALQEKPGVVAADELMAERAFVSESWRTMMAQKEGQGA
jgi:glutamate-ammonia-ligase adenylyltransferase